MNTNAHVRTFLASLMTGISAVTCAHTPVPPYLPTELCQPTITEPADAPDPLLIEDAENGDDQVIVQAGRDGYLYTFVDAHSELARRSPLARTRPVPLVGGAHGSRCAWNLRGRLADERIVFAGLGVNFTNPKTAYDASGFIGVSFFARHGAGSSWRIRVHFPDGNTDPDGKVCGDCFNDFGAEVDLTEEWTQYTLLFDSLGQLRDWVTPRPDRLDPSRLFGIQFRVKSMDEPFDIWIDDIAFVRGQSGQATPH